MPDYTRTGVKICDNGYYGVMDPNLKVKSLPNYVEDILKYKSDCLQPSVKHDQGSVIVCSCQSVVLESLSKLMKLQMLKSTDRA